MMSPNDGERCDSLVRELAAARAEIERLQTELSATQAQLDSTNNSACELREKLDRLSKTADGVPITVGMTLVSFEGLEFTARQLTKESVRDFCGATSKWFSVRTCDCYSSRAAAEKARAT